MEWALKAKLNEGDEWTTIHSSNTALGAGKTFEIACDNDDNNYRPEEADFENNGVGIVSQVDITERLPLLSSDEKFPFYRAQGLDLIEY